jgi:hypothetical protein
MVSGYDEIFLAEAGDCAERSRYGSEVKVSALRVGAAVSAVWAAGAAVDAFVSERSGFYRLNDNQGRKSLSKKDLVRIQEEPRAWKKLNRLVKCFHSPGLKTHPRWRDFRALLALRDATVRGNAEHLVTDDWPPGIKPKVFHEDTAAWAADTCRVMLAEAGLHVPKPPKGAVRNVHKAVSGEAYREPSPDYTHAQFPH